MAKGLILGAKCTVIVRDHGEAAREENPVLHFDALLDRMLMSISWSGFSFLSRPVWSVSHNKIENRKATARGFKKECRQTF